MKDTYVSASELADYIYCTCCWADKQEGESQVTEEMVLGSQAHDKLQWTVQLSQFLKQIGIIITIGSIILLLSLGVLLYLIGERIW